MLRLMQIDDIVSADMTHDVLKGKSLLVPSMGASCQVPQHLRGGPLAFREDIDVGNGVGAELISFSRRRNILHECLIYTRPFETLQEVGDLVIGRIGRDQDSSSVEFRQGGGGAGGDVRDIGCSSRHARRSLRDAGFRIDRLVLRVGNDDPQNQP